eukprot:9183526-Lingulodinium_polyedra.AAC.1
MSWPTQYAAAHRFTKPAQPDDYYSHGLDSAPHYDVLTAPNACWLRTLVLCGSTAEASTEQHADATKEF